MANVRKEGGVVPFYVCIAPFVKKNRLFYYIGKHIPKSTGLEFKI